MAEIIVLIPLEEQIRMQPMTRQYSRENKITPKGQKVIAHYGKAPKKGKGLTLNHRIQ